MSMQIRSPAFEDAQPIPVQHTADGEDISPPLSWEGLPPGTQELALVCDDPDAPTPEPWVHWLIYKIPPDLQGLPAGLPTSFRLKRPLAALQGRNSWPAGQTLGYRGPAPPRGHGVHRYRFRLYALSAELDVQPGLDKKGLLKAMEGRILAEAEMVGTYRR